MKKRACALLLLLVLCLSLCACGAVPGAPADPAEAALTITVFSFEKADAILVECGNETMLIDCGERENAPRLLRELEARGIDRLDYLQITHYDKDHVGGAAAIASALEIGAILRPDYEGTRTEYISFSHVIARHPNAAPLSRPESYTLGAAVFTVYPAEDPSAFDDAADGFDNDMSLVTLLNCGEKRFLFCGDIENARIRQMLRSQVDWSCDWIKLPHHGKYGKMLDRLLKSCGAPLAVMTPPAEGAEEKTRSLLLSLGIECCEACEEDVVTTLRGGEITVEYRGGKDGETP